MSKQRSELIRTIRTTGRVIAKGRKFRLSGYARDGATFSDEVWTIKFIAEPNVTGVLENKCKRVITVYDAFDSDWAFGDHLERCCDEFIGLHRCPENAVQSDVEDDDFADKLSNLWAAPCTDPVFSFRHALFEQWYFDTEGVIVTEVE